MGVGATFVAAAALVVGVAAYHWGDLEASPPSSGTSKNKIPPLQQEILSVTAGKSEELSSAEPKEYHVSRKALQALVRLMAVEIGNSEEQKFRKTRRVERMENPPWNERRGEPYPVVGVSWIRYENLDGKFVARVQCDKVVIDAEAAASPQAWWNLRPDDESVRELKQKEKTSFEMEKRFQDESKAEEQEAQQDQAEEAAGGEAQNLSQFSPKGRGFFFFSFLSVSGLARA